MKIGVVSDTHGDLKGWRAAQGVFKGADYIVHAGDILYHGPFNPILTTYNPLKLAKDLNRSPIPIIFAKGNCDSDVDTLALEYPIENPYAFIFVEGLRIMVNHGDRLESKSLADLAKKYLIDILIIGHTHIYQVERSDDIIILNPGSPSIPKGAGIPTVAVIKIEESKRNIEIVNIEAKKGVQSIEF